MLPTDTACTQAVNIAMHADLEPRTPELIVGVAGECDTLASRQCAFADVRAAWAAHDMRLRIARLKRLGYTDAILKGDGEPAFVQLLHELKQRRSHSTQIQGPPPSV